MLIFPDVISTVILSGHYINSKRKTESDIGDLIHVDDSGNTSMLLWQPSDCYL